MTSTEMHMAHLTDTQLQRVRTLESKLGTYVVAVDRPPEYADLTPEQLAELQAAERELGTVLLAYRKN
ncbi:MAG TPA: hypothetical protein VNN09_09040 [Candidatus Competibacteraceae bacterium]|nr:hypothetical protein [Candidatus Competibacteraceae bacterium]